MDESQKPESLVRSQRGALAFKASSLVKRGLQDLGFTTPHWTSKHVSDEFKPFPCVSPLGYVAASTVSSNVETFSIRIYNPGTGRWSTIDSSHPTAAARFYKPGFAKITEFSWAPLGRYLLALTCEPLAPLRLYDVNRSEFLGAVGESERPTLASLAATSKVNQVLLADWSPKGNISIVTRGDILKAWRVEFDKERALKLTKGTELDFRKCFHTSDHKLSINEIALNPDETLIAVTAKVNIYEKVRGEHYLVVLDASNGEELFRSQTPDPSGGLSWASSDHLIACFAKREVYSYKLGGELSVLPIPANACLCNPIDDLCAFSLDSSVFVVRMTDLVTVTEQSRLGWVEDMSWSQDGKKLYVVTSEGDLWTCTFLENS